MKNEQLKALAAEVLEFEAALAKKQAALLQARQDALHGIVEGFRAELKDNEFLLEDALKLLQPLESRKAKSKRQVSPASNEPETARPLYKEPGGPGRWHGFGRPVSYTHLTLPTSDLV